MISLKASKRVFIVKDFMSASRGVQMARGGQTGILVWFLPLMSAHLWTAYSTSTCTEQYMYCTCSSPIYCTYNCVYTCTTYCIYLRKYFRTSYLRRYFRKYLRS